MKRKYLLSAVVVLGLTGLALAAIPFIQTFNPTARAINGLPHIDISELEKGRYVRVDWVQSRVFVLRLPDDTVRVYSVGFTNGRYWLPHFDGVKGWALCRDFGPDGKDGVLDINARFRCRDSDIPSLREERFAWDLAGRNLESRADDLTIPKYRIQAGFVVLGLSPS